jgi:2-polyprenyl-6-methoxyphenol hydroxylase-like FAD-dependent oxidoreductase
MNTETYDVIVIGGGPSGATAADDLASKGWNVSPPDRSRTHQTLRWCHSSSFDQRLLHTSIICWSQRHAVLG